MCPEVQASPDDVAALAGARQAYLNMDYEKVVHLTRAPSSDPDLPRARRVEALELLGLSQLILGRSDEARRSFQTLLALEPAHKLRDPSGSPKLQRFFETVRQEVGAAPSPGEELKVVPEAPSLKLRAGSTLQLRARLSGAEVGGASIQAMLRWRTSRVSTWSGAPMTLEGDRLTARLLLPPSEQRYKLLYQVILRSQAGNLLARVGSSKKPLELSVAPGQLSSARPVWKRWWFWTVIGAVVVGGVTTGAVLLTREGAPQGNLEPGVVQLR